MSMILIFFGWEMSPLGTANVLRCRLDRLLGGLSGRLLVERPGLVFMKTRPGLPVICNPGERATTLAPPVWQGQGLRPVTVPSTKPG